MECGSGGARGRAVATRLLLRVLAERHHGPATARELGGGADGTAGGGQDACAAEGEAVDRERSPRATMAPPWKNLLPSSCADLGKHPLPAAQISLAPRDFHHGDIGLPQSGVAKESPSVGEAAG